MPIRDVAAMNAFLDNNFGATHGTHAPASWDLALFDGDPLLDGVELDSASAPGYDRVTVANDASWLAATDGEKTLAAPVQFPAPTDAWVEASHWGLFAAGTEVLWVTEALTEVLEVTAASTDGPLILPTVFIADSVDIPEA